jgi:hypothetical protein
LHIGEIGVGQDSDCVSDISEFRFFAVGQYVSLRDEPQSAGRFFRRFAARFFGKRPLTAFSRGYGLPPLSG